MQANVAETRFLLKDGSMCHQIELCVTTGLLITEWKVEFKIQQEIQKVTVNTFVEGEG